MNGRRLRVFIGLGAALLLALVLLVPLAGATTAQPTPRMMGSPMPSPSATMMPTPSPSPSSTMMPTPTPSPTPSSTAAPGSWCGGGFWDGTGTTWGGTGMWGTAFGATWLRNHPDAFDAWLTLRNDHMTELRAWYDQYKDDLTSSAAQQALQALWQDHWNDMKAFYQQYANGTTWVCPALEMWGGMMGGGMMGGGWTMWGTGYGSGWLMKHPGAFAGWQTLRTKQFGQVQSWWTTYHAHPFSTAAQNALTTMRSHHKKQDLTFMTNHNVTSNTAWSYRGWMGLGGTWGGWGW